MLEYLIDPALDGPDGRVGDDAALLGAVLGRICDAVALSVLDVELVDDARAGVVCILLSSIHRHKRARRIRLYISSPWKTEGDNRRIGFYSATHVFHRDHNPARKAYKPFA